MLFQKLLLACAVASLAACTVSAPTTAASTRSAPVSGQFHSDLNQFRAANGVAEIHASAMLTAIAQAHAEDMVSRNYFGHASPGGPNGATLSQRMRAGGCRPGAAAENIAQGQQTDASVFAAWRDSAGHRTNMLGNRYIRYGLGRAGNTWVTVFAAGC
ncbi:CAP domain-containing protein [Loktanella sp. D2R18]|uniref:CAP domain-containing protein n=1 Tax=Rhodobacterales TaxID=204455 RepID=UPI000DEB53B1|nr:MULTISPECIES: CAP domain-containing protein [Rhodobacterales]MDO6589218.1 CAP domain-containing protein [Yoonia sp. 1_MG-2023]RBW45356.1 CAP domain-containing protein [Loktanella sp. D2R18]